LQSPFTSHLVSSSYSSLRRLPFVIPGLEFHDYIRAPYRLPLVAFFLFSTCYPIMLQRYRRRPDKAMQRTAGRAAI
jgi:hypothetical protein